DIRVVFWSVPSLVYGGHWAEQEKVTESRLQFGFGSPKLLNCSGLRLHEWEQVSNMSASLIPVTYTLEYIVASDACRAMHSSR
ncbi:hypothetical protein KSS87_014161, partial [Heliosperma pusillum]